MHKIAIHADGGSEIGMGHIMRTLVLAKELDKTNEVFYICRANNPLSNKYKKGIEKIKSYGFNVKLINENNMLSELNNIQADMLITDSYDVDEEYFNNTKSFFKKTGYIDDMNLHYFNVDFLVNQNIDAECYNYEVNTDTKLFLGTKYVMLREEFRNSPQKFIKRYVSDILVTLGGADPNCITEMILNDIKDLNYNFHITIGPSFSNIEKIKQIATQYKNITLYFNANMFELMNKCDIAISGCGTTLYELMACGVPTIGIVLVDNQKNIADYMEKNNLIIKIGKMEDINMGLLLQIRNMTYSRRRKMSVEQIKKNNFAGVENLAKLINNIIINN